MRRDNSEENDEELREATLKPRKKRGPKTPNKWRAIVLMDMTSKLIAIIINIRLHYC